VGRKNLDSISQSTKCQVFLQCCCDEADEDDDDGDEGSVGDNVDRVCS